MTFRACNLITSCLRAGSFILTLLILSPDTLLGAVILFEDHFDQPVLNTEWSVNQQSVNSPLGLTQTYFSPEITNEGTARFRFDTYNPDAPGALFRGTEIATQTQFAVGDGLTFEVRWRASTPLPEGLVLGFSTFGQGNGVDRIDFDVLSKVYTGTSNMKILTNVSGTGNEIDPILVVSPNPIDFSEFNTFKILWEPDSIKWFINDHLVLARTDVVGLADSNMGLHLNFWAPDQSLSSFSEAYDPNFQPTANSSQNQSFFFEVDSVTISAIPEPEYYVFFLAFFLLSVAAHRKSCDRKTLSYPFGGSSA